MLSVGEGGGSAGRHGWLWEVWQAGRPGRGGCRSTNKDENLIKKIKSYDHGRVRTCWAAGLAGPLLPRGVGRAPDCAGLAPERRRDVLSVGEGGGLGVPGGAAGCGRRCGRLWGGKGRNI